MRIAIFHFSKVSANQFLAAKTSFSTDIDMFTESCFVLLYLEGNYSFSNNFFKSNIHRYCAHYQGDASFSFCL